MPANPPLPTKIGFEAAGEIEAIGANVEGFALGDRVALVPAYAAAGMGCTVSLRSRQPALWSRFPTP